METITNWIEDFEELMEGIGGRFARSEARGWAAGYVRGLMSNIPRKNGWQMAEELGERTPYGIQQFLYRARWEADEVRDDLQAYVIEHLSDEAGVLVVDETGFLKKGEHSVGVQVQYCGTARGKANCQVGVFLTYASVQGLTFVDRALYLPESWTADRERCRAAGVPDKVEFATKPALGKAMLERALGAGVSAKWVTGDSVYGSNYPLRRYLESIPLGYVMGISPKDTLLNLQGFPQRVSDYLSQLPEEGWSRLSAGAGAKGERWYDWLRIPLGDPERPGWKRWLLLRRKIDRAGKITPYICFAQAGTTLQELVTVAGKRWTVEQCFESAKQEVGLDEYEVRSYQGWYRHITLACLAHAFLTVLRAKGLDPLTEMEREKKVNSRPVRSLRTFKLKRGLISP
jgi:SRSO17 transposase